MRVAFPIVKEGDNAIVLEVPDEFGFVLQRAKVKSIKMDNGSKIKELHIDEVNTK